MKKMWCVILLWCVSLPFVEKCLADETDEKTDHTIGLVWRANGETNLMSLIGPSPLPDDIRTNLYFTSCIDAKGAKTEVADNILAFGDRPDDLKPTIYHIEVRYRPRPDEIFDRMWIVINSPSTLASFNKWVAKNTDTSWTTNLPPPFASIKVTNNNPADPEPPTGIFSDSGVWHYPESKKSYLHHNSPFEMRSKPVRILLHGHQAMYDANGILIESTIAAGTADLWAPYDADNNLYLNFNHLEEDVKPFIRALQLDGNPVHPTDVYRNLSRPCIYQGDYTDTYIKKRPTLPTGKR